MRWRKVQADWSTYRAQIILIGLVLTLGAAGVVAMMDAQLVLRREIAASYRGAAAPDLALWFETVDAPLLAQVAAQPGVRAVDARRVTFVRLTDSAGNEVPVRLTLVKDPLTMKLASVHRHEDGGPAGDTGVWIEQSGESLLGLRAGEPIRLRTPDGGSVEVPLAGYLHDPGVAPSTQERMLYAYASTAWAQRLKLRGEPDQLLVQLELGSGTGAAMESGQQLGAAATSAGHELLRVEALPAGHPHALLMTALLRVFGALSGLAYTSSAAWAAYMAALWMRREVRVVGILKTLGARTHQIASQYLVLGAPLVLLAAALALPLGALLGRALVRYYAVSLNIDISDMAVGADLRGFEVMLALGLPLLAVALPILRAARMTPRQAIQDAGVLPPTGAGRWRARLLRLPGQYEWTLALRNSFRRPWRLLLLLLALGSAGALLLTTHSNYESLMQVIDRSLEQQGHDLEVVLQSPAPPAALERIAQAQPGVTVAEAWRRVAVEVGVDSGTLATHARDRVPLAGYPTASRLFQLRVVQGRKAADHASNEVLVSRALADRQPGIQLGQTLHLRYRDRETRVVVVGLVEEIAQAQMYAPSASFEAITGLGDAAGVVRIRAQGAAIPSLARALDQAFLDARHTPRQIITRDQVRESLDEHFKVVGDFIRMVALATALVGAIWLAASSSLNVQERTREIGVLRTLGATPWTIAAIFVAEGAAVALLSALLAIGASLVLTSALNSAASTGLLHVEVPLRFSWQGLAILALGVVVVVLTVALAVQRPLRLSARDALAYE
jgi:putative ABC transport system permease protein